MGDVRVATAVAIMWALARTFEARWPRLDQFLELVKSAEEGLLSHIKTKPEDVAEQGQAFVVGASAMAAGGQSKLGARGSTSTATSDRINAVWLERFGKAIPAFLEELGKFALIVKQTLCEMDKVLLALLGASFQEG